ncbi:MAG: endonuclease III, partial [Chloroflexi bacterium]|nr:endonuclease III [Chloroflexota bacterium]
MSRSQRATCALESLRMVIPAPETELTYTDSWQLLVAVVLSAQCTDARVNQITPALFERFPDAASTAKSTPEEVFPFIRSISYPNNKSRHLVGAAQMVMSDFGGRVPETVDEIVMLPGAGRKTAQVVASVAFG